MALNSKQLIFQDVFNSNLESLKNSLVSKGFEQSVLTSFDHLTDDEVRRLAVKSFIHELSKSLTEKLK